MIRLKTEPTDCADALDVGPESEETRPGECFTSLRRGVCAGRMKSGEGLQ
jgi:hypothetical protein